ncbi:Guanosine-diphosphatase [Entomophthora muscae]|uniref:Guanosine-diphosphatase n=1 Tax=Entomophthora muscae TaxID=34485 RepID=A0ACC2TMR5_9FUNG|nr:Guanosine-diphosphatase [Entomophthora muscae]
MLVQVDQGSHVYRFNYCKQTPEIEDEVFLQLQPGLSSYIDKPEKAAESLDELMDAALTAVPKELHHCTPVAVKATAGLRLHLEKSTAVLEAVKKRLTEKYPFPLIPDDPVSIMDGKDEGVFAWITVNYLLGKLDHAAGEYTSAATIDLGGGSVQIVFEPNFTGGKEIFHEGEFNYNLTFAERTHKLYQHSHLGYGLNEARKAIKNKAIESWISSNKPGKTIEFPCFSPGSEEKIKYNDEFYTLVGANTSQEGCSRILNEIFSQSTQCKLDPCYINGVYQPKLSETFESNDIYAFSFFYDRTFPFGLRDSFKVKDIKHLATRICSSDFDSFKNVPNAVDELKVKFQRCLDVSYLHALLTRGFGLDAERKLLSAKKINGLETGWCLGAAIAVLDQNNYCTPN